MSDNTFTLTKSILETASELYDAIDGTGIADKAIRYALSQFPTNDDPVGVCIKAILVNTLYQTAIINISRMASYIVEKNIDPKLQASDVSVIDDIRSGHKIRTTKGNRKEIDFYSFATKYAHFHMPSSYPIYDNLVMRLVTEANRKMKFHERFTQSQLLDYSIYKSVIDSLARHLGIANWGYKKIDQGLWVCAKYRYQEGLPSGVTQRLKHVISA
jgi:hypothetical protein